jgi:outer membrane protein OmpA-like peptidoglycan-associated protein
LIENGIAASRLTSAGFGESKPIDTNKTKAGKANNRRVEVKLVK